ncbi:hypothetical protein BHY_1239 (plasmid) [Borrelia nietonii YOR]|uniref:Variable large protein n=1 Tax=Borrelia nietonii YOR TaxID=1293576 RepID=W5SB79_9SPIR|nr:hypothetical protein BHY_1239 [Borrelia nietonii YOR]
MIFKCVYIIWGYSCQGIRFSTETKKSDVGAYFKTVQDTIQGTKDKLNKIVADMKREGNPNAAEVDNA